MKKYLQNQNLVLLHQTPRQLILAETDNPTSEPWLGGTDNSVHLINRVYNDISKVLGMPVEAVEKMITENALQLLNNVL